MGTSDSRRDIVFGAVERGGRIRTTVIPSSHRQVLTEQVREVKWVLPGLIERSPVETPGPKP